MQRINAFLVVPISVSKFFVVFWPLVIFAGGNLVSLEWVLQGVDDIFVAAAATYFSFLYELEGLQT